MLESFNDLFVFDSDESDVGAEALAPSSDENDIRHVLEFLNFPNSLSLFSEVAKVMGAVNDEKSVVLLSDFLIKHYIR